MDQRSRKIRNKLIAMDGEEEKRLAMDRSRLMNGMCCILLNGFIL